MSSIRRQPVGPDQDLPISSLRGELFFDYLAKSFADDYMRRRYAIETSGWRSLVEAARAIRLAPRLMYGASGGFSSFVNELVETGLVELRVFPGQRGRGGEISKFRVCYDRKPVQTFIDALVMGPVRGRERPRETLERATIAVLPFVSISADPKDDYFVEGMTEELISTISRIDGLRIIAKRYFAGYKADQKSIGEIASELKVGSVIEGSVRRDGKKVRINVQLVDATTGSHLWTETYNRELRDVFEVQSDVARRVSERLRAHPRSSRLRRFVGLPPNSAEAYELYAQGRYQFRKFTNEGLEASLEFYRRALEIDPGFAPAYEGMAATQQMFGFLNVLPEKEAYPSARELAEKALGLNDSLAESHYILGRTLVEYYWALEAGEAEIRKSIALGPKNAAVHLAYGWLLASQLKSEKASSEAERAVKLDPESAEAWWSGSYTSFLLSQFEKGVEYGQRAIELNPFDPNSHLFTSFNHVHSGSTTEAIKEAREADMLSNHQAYYRANLGAVYGLAGMRDEAKRVLEGLVEVASTEYVAPILMAWAYAGAGDSDNFFAWLERAYEERSSSLVYTMNDPFTFRMGFHSDPRFSSLMRKIGIETKRQEGRGAEDASRSR